MSAAIHTEPRVAVFLQHVPNRVKHILIFPCTLWYIYRIFVIVFSMCILLISRIFLNKQTIYTVHHLCRITLLVERVTSQLAEVFVNVNIRHLTIFKRHIVTLWQSLVVDYHFSTVLVSFISRECWFPQLSNCPKGSVAHLCWSHSAVSRCCMQIVILNQSGNYANTKVYEYFKYIFRFSDLGLSQRDMPKITGVSQGHICPTVLPKGYMGIDRSRPYRKKTVSFSVWWGRAGVCF